MKTSKILVSALGASIGLSSGNQVKAVYPAGKGMDKSFLLLTSGEMTTLKGARIQGVGAARFFVEKGFEPAQAGDVDAETLADLVDANEGLDFVEKANSTYAQELHRNLAGQRCTYVPFDESKPSVPVTVSAPRGSWSVAFDLQNAFTSGQVPIESLDESRNMGSSVSLSMGWLVPPDGDASIVLRNSEYGGVVEWASLVVANSGLGTIIGHKYINDTLEIPMDESYPKGRIDIQRPNGDIVTIGIDAGDTLNVDYTRDGVALYRREGFAGSTAASMRMGKVVGAIAAVIIRVQEMDAVPVKSPRKRSVKTS